MVWRFQNPAIQIQTPLFRRVQWFLGRKQRKTHTSKAHFRKKLGEVLEFNNRFATLGPGGLWHNNFHFLVLMLAACLELHRGTGRRHDYPGTWNIHLKKWLFPLDDEPNLYMGNGFFTKHSLKISCLGFRLSFLLLVPSKRPSDISPPRTIIRLFFLKTSKDAGRLGDMDSFVHKEGRFFFETLRDVPHRSRMSYPFEWVYSLATAEFPGPQR